MSKQIKGKDLQFTNETIICNRTVKILTKQQEEEVIEDILNVIKNNELTLTNVIELVNQIVKIMFDNATFKNDGI